MRLAVETREKLAQAAVLVSREQYAKADEWIGGIPASAVGLEYASLYRTLGGWNAIHENWTDAIQRFAVVSQMDLPDAGDIIYDYLRYGPVLVTAGDLAGYERFCRSAIARYARTGDPVTAERVLKISLLTPADRQVTRSLQPLAELAAQSLEPSRTTVNPGMAAWCAFSLSLMKYRQDDYAGAAAMCECGLGYQFPNEVQKASLGLVLALAHFRLGQTEVARNELGPIRTLLENHRETGANFYWFDWLLAKVLLREAIQEMAAIGDPPDSHAPDEVAEPR